MGRTKGGGFGEVDNTRFFDLEALKKKKKKTGKRVEGQKGGHILGRG